MKILSITVGNVQIFFIMMRSSSIFQPIKNNNTLKNRTVELLSDAILSGKIKPGERLNESQLARELHVSRAPVREALQHLQEQSLIVNIPRRGMFVVSLDEEDIKKINSLRVVLEAEALRLARQNLTPQRRKTLEQLLEQIENIEPVPAKLSMRIDFEFHRTIWSYSANDYLEKVLSSLTAPLFAHSVRINLRTDKLRMVLDSHRPMFNFVCGNSQLTAEQVMLEHLSIRYHEPEKFTSLSLSTV
ncbi:MAG: GntR family transcriptional regulator [Terriglobales bacterium]